MTRQPTRLLSLLLPFVCLSLTSCKVCEERWDQDKVPPGIQLTKLADRSNPELPEVKQILDAGLRDISPCIDTFDGAKLKLSLFLNKQRKTCPTQVRLMSWLPTGFSVGDFEVYDSEWTTAFELDPSPPCPTSVPNRSCWSLSNVSTGIPPIRNADIHVHLYSPFEMPEDLEFGSGVTAKDFGPPATGEPPPIIMVRQFEMRNEDTPFPHIEPDADGIRRCADIFLGYFEKP